MANTPSLNASVRLLSTAPGPPVPAGQPVGWSAGRWRGGGGRRCGGGGRRWRLHGADQDLGDVHDFEGVFGFAGGFLGGDGVAQHDQAVGAAGGDGVRVGAERFVDPLGVDALADPLFHPHPGAARAAAEAAVLAPVHLLGLHAGDLLHDFPRRGEHLVVPAQETRVVIGDLLLHLVDRGDLALRDQPGQELGVVDDLVVAAELGVLVRDRVEAVRAGRDDRLGRGLVQGLDVLLGEHGVDELVAHPARRVPGAGLGRAENGEADPGLVQQGGDGLGGLFRPVFQRPGAADPEQVLDAVIEFAVGDGDVEVEFLGPGQPPARAHAPGVALVLQVLQHPRGFGRERRLDQDLVAAHPVDVVDVLDVNRAFLDTRPAVRARPQHVRVDHAVDVCPADQRAARLELHRVRQRRTGLVAVRQQVRSLSQGVVTQVQDHLLG